MGEKTVSSGSDYVGYDYVPYEGWVSDLGKLREYEAERLSDEESSARNKLIDDAIRCLPDKDGYVSFELLGSGMDFDAMASDFYALQIPYGEYGTKEEQAHNELCWRMAEHLKFVAKLENEMEGQQER